MRVDRAARLVRAGSKIDADVAVRPLSICCGARLPSEPLLTLFPPDKQSLSTRGERHVKAKIRF